MKKQSYKAELLHPNDAEKAIEVFCQGNALDPYYQAMFPHRGIIRELLNYYSSDIRFALQLPYSFAVFNKKREILAQLLSINVDIYLSEFPGKIEHLMKAPTKPTQEWNNFIVDYLKSKEHPNIFCFDFEAVPCSAEVEEKLLIACVSKLIETYGQVYTIGSDHSEGMAKLWVKLGFENYTCGDANMCIRPAGGL